MCNDLRYYRPKCTLAFLSLLLTLLVACCICNREVPITHEEEFETQSTLFAHLLPGPAAIGRNESIQEIFSRLAVALEYTWAKRAYLLWPSKRGLNTLAFLHVSGCGLPVS